LEKSGEIGELALLEKFQAFVQSVEGQSRRFVETIDTLTRSIESSADYYRRIRTSAIAGVGSIVIPLLLALAALDKDVVGVAVALSALFVVAAGVLSFWTTLKIDSFGRRCDEIQRGFSLVTASFGAVQNEIRGRISLSGIDNSRITAGQLLDYYDAFILLESAVRHWIINVAGGDWTRLDEPTRRVYEAQARVYCLNKEQGFLATEGLAPVKDWETFPEMGKIIGEYRQWCANQWRAKDPSSGAK
jgi:hypothetical protein